MVSKFVSTLFRIGAVIAFAVAFLCIGFIGGKCERLADAKSSITADTVKCRDTITVKMPIPILTTIVDTILVPCVDVITIRDTVYAQLPIEQKEYRDTNYRAVVSGFRPNLDMIEVYPITTTVTVTKTLTKSQGDFWNSKRFGFGVAIGPSALITPAGNIRAGLGVTGGFYLRL